MARAIPLPRHRALPAQSSREKEQLLNRARSVFGQVAALERAIEADRECVDIVNLIVAVRGALNGMMAVALEDHIVDHVLDPTQRVNGPRGRAGAELISIVKSYVK